MAPLRPSRARVIIRRCGAYDAARIREIARSGLEALGLRPFGRVLVKPNLVMSGPGYDHVYTRPEFTEGVLGALRDAAPDGIGELAVGERCGLHFPSRFAFEKAGYNPVLKKLGARRYCFDEEQQVEVRFSHPGRLRDSAFVPRPVARADFFVNCPKFKLHELTTVTFSLKNYIGLQDDRHRIIDHDYRLDEKVADLQHVVQPAFVAVDAIQAAGASLYPGEPYAMNLIILGDNQVAVDAICCRIAGIDPAKVAHIRLAHERGFGPIALEQIALLGDVTLDEAADQARGLKRSLPDIGGFLKTTPIVPYLGPPPDPAYGDYCRGGCPPGFAMVVQLLLQEEKRFCEKMPRTHVVFGAYDGPIDAAPGEPVAFIGDCARWSGRIGDRQVEIESVYRDRGLTDPGVARPRSALQLLFEVRRAMRIGRKRGYIRLLGCPVFMAESTVLLTGLGKLGSVTPRGLARSVIASKAARALRRLQGEKYQLSGGER